MRQPCLKHRGPDDEGSFYDLGTGVGLTHTRLSILDVTKAGHQPMVSDDVNFVIVFNGEIYNFKELRKDLKKEITLNGKVIVILSFTQFIY